MKKQLFNALLFCLLAMPAMSIRADVIDEGQSTEGKDFWVTFMQADQDPNNDLTLSLSISSREDCQVTITNPFSGYTENVNVTANQMQLVELYSGNVLSQTARAASTPAMYCLRPLVPQWQVPEKYAMRLIRSRWILVRCM